MHAARIEHAAAKGRTPVVFIHGLWLHASSWHHWIDWFGTSGFAAIAPAWPGEALTVDGARGDPNAVANLGIEPITQHYRTLLASLENPAVVVGHALGGLIAQKLLGERRVRAAVAVDPLRMRGVLQGPTAAVTRALSGGCHPVSLRGATSLTADRFARSFASEVSRDESDRLYERYAVPSPGRPLVEVGMANLVASTPARVAVDVDRGPLLILAGGRNRTVPPASSRSVARRYESAQGITEYREFEDRGHSLVVDAGWPEIADYVLGWLAFQSIHGA
jgi:alpha-beta hydrolase superfamily lysophospholipase